MYPFFNPAPFLNIEITLSSGTNTIISGLSKFLTKGFSVLPAISIQKSVMYFIQEWCFVCFLIVLKDLIALLSALVQWKNLF